MSTKVALTIGGVPEHFNLPWHLATEEGRFADAGIELHWADCPGGTGEMTRGLAAGELDLALTLSEGAVSAIARNVPMRILQWYVRSPLIWGIHVPSASDFHTVKSLRGQRFAISREGSGSHLMAFVNARQQGWDPARDLHFVEVGTLGGAIECFERAGADGFLWERFTTQPYVDRGLMRRVGECPTPWPAFTLTASDAALARSPDAIDAVMRVINETCAGIRNRPDIVGTIAARYCLETEEAAEWLRLTEWADSRTMHREELRNIIDALAELDLLERQVTPEDCCARFATI